jgi:hypothetical protein
MQRHRREGIDTHATQPPCDWSGKRYIDLHLCEEDSLVEGELKSLVGKVNEQLLKIVFLEGFEPENVQQADERQSGRTFSFE